MHSPIHGGPVAIEIFDPENGVLAEVAAILRWVAEIVAITPLPVHARDLVDVALAGHLCLRRDHFAKVVFRWALHGNAKCARCALAQQRAYIVGFVAVTPAEAAQPSSIASSLTARIVPDSRHLFEFKLGEGAFSDERRLEV